MILGYARVSTPDQNLKDQRQQLLSAGAEEVFTDIASGARSSRPGLDALLEKLQSGDQVVVWRLDRLGRSMLHTLSMVERFRDNRVGFRSLADGIDGDTSAGRLMIGLLASIAEYEHELIRERTTAGLTTARAQGRVGEQPRAMTPEKTQRVQGLRQKGLSAAEIGKVLGVSRSTAYAYLKQVQTDEDSALET